MNIYFQSETGWKTYNLESDELEESDPPEHTELSEDMLIEIFKYIRKESK